MIIVFPIFKVVMLTCLLRALVIMDQLSEQVEAFPTRKTVTVGVIKTSLPDMEYLKTWNLLEVLTFQQEY